MQDNSSISSPTPTNACASSKSCCALSSTSLPPFLHNTEPLEWEDIPLQVSLLTMEVAELRNQLAAMSRVFSELALMVRPAAFLTDMTADG